MPYDFVFVNAMALIGPASTIGIFGFASYLFIMLCWALFVVADMANELSWRNMASGFVGYVSIAPLAVLVHYGFNCWGKWSDMTGFVLTGVLCGAAGALLGPCADQCLNDRG